MKKDKRNKQVIKEKKVKTMHVGVHRKAVRVMWVLLILSVVFGIYKNFTAIDRHTVHEKQVVEKRVIDTNKVESFVRDFVKVYYTWGQVDQALEKRNEDLKKYLTEELQTLNGEMLGEHVATASVVKELQIWDVEQEDDHVFSVLYSVTRTITDVVSDEGEKDVESAFRVRVYVDDQENMVITQNPTVSSVPEKSDYQPKVAEHDGTVDAAMTDEVTEFLETFFSLYPTATKKELAYYVKDDALQPISGEYVFSELLNPVYRLEKDVVVASVSVKYIDQQTKTAQISQFDLRLEKSDNWMIIN